MREKYAVSLKHAAANGLLLAMLVVCRLCALDVGVGVMFDPAIAVLPIFDGDKVMYQDFRDGKYQFISRTLQDSEDIVRDNGFAYHHPFDFGGTLLVWLEFASGYGGGGLRKARAANIEGPIDPNSGGGNYYMRVRKLSDGSEPTVTTDIGYKECVATDGQYAVWTDYRHFAAGDTTVELYLYDASSGSEKRLTSRQGYKAQPMVHGNAVVWQDYRNDDGRGNADIYYATLPGGQEKAICTEGSYQGQPATDGSIVVWQDYRNAGSGSNADIYMYDLSSNQTTVVCDNSAYQAHPQVYGDYIVWQDYRNATGSDTGNADIYIYEISTGTERAVVTNAGYQGPPSMDGKNIVWYDYNDGKVYHAEIGAADISPRFARSAAGRVNNGTAQGRHVYDMRGRTVTRASVREGIVLTEYGNRVFHRKLIIGSGR